MKISKMEVGHKNPTADSILPNIRTNNQRNPSLWATVPFLIVSIFGQWNPTVGN